MTGKRFWLGWLVGLAVVLGGSAARGNPIVPANDGVGSVVNRVGNQFDITGGTRAGSNLFHSLLKFGLSAEQIANFLSQPSIRNILTRVTGGETSVINGLIRVTGGNSNLYLMNPAGIVFGAGARLDIPGSFHATTANAIKVGDGWFGMNTSPSELMRLTGEPGGFAFSSLNRSLNGELAGVIRNEGQLVVNAGQRVVLAGGVVVNTGVIETPHGQIVVTASPGGRYVEITPKGSALSFQLPVAEDGSLGVENLRPLRWEDVLPLASGSALVGGRLSVASGVVNRESRIELVGEQVRLLPGVDLDNRGTDGLIQVQVQPLLPVEGWVFLDRVRNYEEITNSLTGGHRLVLLNRTDSGVAKVNQALEGQRGVKSLHLVGDGNAGQIWLGRDFITLERLGDYAAGIGQWGQYLDQEGGIFLYACNLARTAAGQGLVDRIGELTGVRVAASTDVTGHSRYGGNWVLEYGTPGTLPFALTPIEQADVKLLTFTVNAAGDAGNPGELRTELTNANVAVGADTVRFSFGAATTITLALGELFVTDDTTFDIAPGGAAVTIDGNNASRVFNIAANTTVTFDGTGASITITGGNDVNGGGILVNNGANLTLQDNVVVTGNKAVNSGGGIYADTNSTVTITNSQVNGNEAGSDGGGIVAHLNSTVTITNSQVNKNKASFWGGGIVAWVDSTVTITDSQVNENQALAELGGGILADTNSTVTITNSQVNKNKAVFNGGGIFIDATSTLKMTGGEVRENEANVAGAGILNEGNLTLKNVTVADNFGVNDGGGLANAAGATAMIKGSTFSGNVANNGAGIHNQGNLTVINSTIGNNEADLEGGGLANLGGTATLKNVTIVGNVVVTGNTAGNSGGGIFAANSTVTITNSQVNENQALNGDGGGIFADTNSTVTITNSQVNENQALNGDGGGIFAANSTVTITNSQVNKNEAASRGGGIFIDATSTLKMTGGEVRGNEATLAGAGILNDGNLTLKNVTVADNGQSLVLGFPVNDGGGLANALGATATIEESTFSGNVANSGAGIHNQGNLTVINSTIGNNEADLEGGGLANLGGTATLNNVTIVGNKVVFSGGNGGGGIRNAPGSTINISNSIVAGNKDVNAVATAQVSNDGIFTITGRNLVGENGDLGGFPADPSNLVVPGAVIGVQVGPLGSNGGPTQTFALLPGSLAIDASGAGATPADQRGVAAVGVRRDIGAFEYVPPVGVSPGGVPLPPFIAPGFLGSFLTPEQERFLAQPYLCVGEVALEGVERPPLPDCVQAVNVRPGEVLWDFLRN